MSTRFLMGKVAPDAYKAMAALDRFVAGTSIDPLHREMIKIRASQINGCAYCVNHHTSDARKLGETEQRIYLISVWREAGELFTPYERLILKLTETITLISENGVSDELYEQSLGLLGEEQTAALIMTIITINAWNRIGVSLQMPPAF